MRSVWNYDVVHDRAASIRLWFVFPMKSSGRDGADVPSLERGIHMLDRTFRGIDGGSRHYPERPLTAEEAEVAALGEWIALYVS